jgi:hypothetical protein
MRKKSPFWLVAAVVATALLGLSATASAQSFPAGTADEKSEAVIKRAIEVLGGPKYLSVTSVVSTGNFTLFVEGEARGFYTFNDYVLYPDNERTEFKTNGERNVQTNTGQTGWIFDGATRVIKDMKPNQVQDFQWYVLRAGVENLLRGKWRTEGATVKHVGRPQAGIGRRNDALRILYPDGFVAEFEFGPDGFPAKVVYSKKDAEGEEAKEEDRMAQWIEVNGVMAPFIVDHFRGGAQMTRVNYKTIEFNRPLAPAFFARPENVKALK